MRLLLFDVDGTLLNAKRAGGRALMGALVQVFDRPFSRNRVPFAGRTDSGITADLLAANGVPPDEIPAGLKAVFQALPKHMRIETAKSPSEPCPGVVQLLAGLREQKDVLLGLLTGNLRAPSHITITSAGLDPSLFRVGAYGDESADRNALPPIAQKRATDLLGRPPSTAIILGDTPHDIACAQANGLHSLAVATGPYLTDELAAHRPDWVFSDLSDLERVMGVLLGR